VTSSESVANLSRTAAYLDVQRAPQTLVWAACELAKVRLASIVSGS
jgi:hypothetical protein